MSNPWDSTQNNTFLPWDSSKNKFESAKIDAIYNKIQESGKKFSKDMKGLDPIAKGMNQSFQGMQGKASVIQKVIGTAMDTMSIGVDKFRKDTIGAFKKLIQEGDVPGFIQSLIDIKYQFLEMGRLNQPFTVWFGLINSMLSVVAGSATQTVVASEAFQDLVASFQDPDTIADLQAIGAAFGEIAVQLIDDVDLDKVKTILDGVIKFMDAMSKLQTAGSVLGQILGFGVKNPDNTPPPVDELPTAPVSGIQGSPAPGITVNIGGMVRDSQVTRALHTLRRQAALWRIGV